MGRAAVVGEVVAAAAGAEVVAAAAVVVSAEGYVAAEPAWMTQKQPKR